MSPSRSSLAAAALLGSTVFAQGRTLPADPLSNAERERVVTIAAETGVAKALLTKGRFSLVGVELVNPKPADAKADASPDATPRLAAVLFFDYAKNQGLSALVDATTGSARDFVAVDSRSVPIGREEVERAARIALANPAVGKLLGDKLKVFRVGIPRSDDDSTIEGLRAIGAGPKDPCYRRRCVDLFFRHRGTYVAGSRVTVDLVGERVTVVNTPEGR